ncbi:hypothetical protein BK784_24330 [Bacillus thuringiensis serovar medellin]|uniref:Lipoprotein n=1 Tax=Bacillus thuringiensis subsp. medellin TaxID=79672 RepID=A0A9X6RCT9_BACTV|nr:hypothetical protein [Bacillus thuringiensis]OUB91404.1 hypothetical protein BK784_24330 [Bacillus thuringiensis serovar medellin]
MIKKLVGIFFIIGLLGGCTLDQEDKKTDPQKKEVKKANPIEPSNRKKDAKPGDVRQFQLNEDGSMNKEVEVDKNAKPVDSTEN